ncbi:carboxymuconolactone decarboxylase family protein [Zoogloea dura]|jgi:AhpD family alkylhydroperoxidase|uniref:Carboxymuconolactone decarboxylase family protein n=1 Tax=Zoogloea dura TaxID=2728840 RepID=A0A848G7C5_9RHOO|nr:carboxymuconolactone decarboxylase family protein [Zoogloea dura]NML28117.1 carboxymuconolactone decarboxylase family protein [Zoogloea dura]
MEQLTHRERELVALGAALGCNCIPCIEHHIPEARKSGLSDMQIKEAIALADQVRQVPARNVLKAALQQFDAAGGSAQPETTQCADLSKNTSRCC